MIVFKLGYFARKMEGKRNKMKNYKRIILKRMILGIFVIYLGLLIYLTLIQENDYVYGNAANLDLFSTIILMWNSGNPYLVLINVFGNIALFTPLGFLIPLMARKLDGPVQVVITGFFTSFFIEMLQYKATNRVFDVDDIFLNSIGAVIGWIISWLIRRIHQNNTNK